MSILNIAMQGVGLAREQMSDETEQQLAGCSSMKQIIAQAHRAPVIEKKCWIQLPKLKCF